MLDAVTFDFWGTLYQNAEGREERLRILGDALAQYGQPRSLEDLAAAYQRAFDRWGEVWRREHRSISADDWLREAFACLDVELPHAARAALLRPIEEVFLHNGLPQPIPGVSEVLPRLATRYRLGLISDTGITPGRVLREILRRDGLLDYFQALTFSDETGATKPLPGQFLRTLEALGARPEASAHIGDLPETDLLGAKNVGMRAVLFLGVSDRQDGMPLSDGAFREYHELEPLLERL